MDYSQFKKLEPVEARACALDAGSMVTAIVKVRQAHYHPPLLAVRSQIDEWLFTAEFKARDLAQLESDPMVETVSLAKALPSY